MILYGSYDIIVIITNMNHYEPSREGFFPAQSTFLALLRKAHRRWAVQGAFARLDREARST